MQYFSMIGCFPAIRKTDYKIFYVREKSMDKNRVQNGKRNEIVMAIAQRLLDEELLDINNFSYDTDTMLQCVSKIILKHLEDYTLVIGTVV